METGMARPGTPYDNIPDPSPLSEEILGALETMETAREEIRQAREVLRARLEKLVQFYFPQGSVVGMWDTRAGRIRVISGSAYGSTIFRIDSTAFVDVNANTPM